MKDQAEIQGDADPCNQGAFHRQTFIERADGSFVNVDAGIADLLVLLWGRGVKTRYSCEGFPQKRLTNRRNAYIMFESGQDMEAFASLFTPTSGLFLEATDWDYAPGKYTWAWEVMPCPLPFDEIGKVKPEFTGMRLHYSVRFPPEHIARMVQFLSQVS